MKYKFYIRSRLKYFKRIGFNLVCSVEKNNVDFKYLKKSGGLI